jgi:hypothetical protein
VTDDLLLFQVDGPYEIWAQSERGGRIITAEAGPELFERANGLGDEVGCFVFAIRAGPGMTPWYVGKTANGFRWECFQPHKLNKYNEALVRAGYGTPILFFVVYPRTRGRVSKVAIDELETFLIQVARNRNPALLNKTKDEVPGWAIQGLGTGRGRRSAATVQLARTVGIG